MAGSRRRQTRLAFTPLPSSSPAANGYNKQIQDRAAQISIDSPTKRRKLQHNGETGSETIPTPTASREKTSANSASDSDSEPVRLTQRSSAQRSTKRTRRSKQQRIDFSAARDPDSFSSPIRLTSSPSNKPSSSGPGMFSSQRRSVVLDSSSGSEGELPSTEQLASQSRRARRAKRNGDVDSAPLVTPSEDEDALLIHNTKSRSEAAQIQNQDDDDDDDDDDDMPTTLGTQRRRRKQRNPRDDFVVSSPPELEDSGSEVEIIEHPRKRRRREVSDEEDEVITPRSKRQMSQREKDELAEDLDFLQPSSDEEDGIRPPGGTQSMQKAKRSDALARLKRSRSGKAAQLEQAQEDGESGSEDALPVSSAGIFNADEDDDDFVEEEEVNGDEPLGYPEDMPIMFTHHARQRPKELFKYAVEWMVQNKINPAFERNNELYKLTFQKLDDETTGLVGSKFVSSVWTAEFANALKARPEIAKNEFDRNAAENFGVDKCDACNRTNHPPAYEVQFQGKPYSLDTLEDLGRNYDDDEDDNDDSESDSKDSDSHPTYDAKGNEISPETRIFYVGRFCMANAQTAHALQHWRYHLNAYIVTWLTRAGYETAEAVVKREKMSAKKRRKHANKIVDMMEEEGLIKSLWNDFRQNIDEARNAKQGRF